MKYPEKGTFDKSLEILDRIPKEAMSKIVDLFVDVVRANKIMDANEQKFEHEIEKIRENHSDRKHRMETLGMILNHPNISEKDRSMLIQSICHIAEA